MSIATEIQRLQQAKADIKTAIEEKGVTVGDGTIDTFADKIKEITGGGGGAVEGYCTVTFMNCGKVIFSRLVLAGDNCPNPLTQGRIETPIKESTVQYDYTFSGWSEPLTNITEDKVINAVYTETVRKYTVTFYDTDGTTVLHTEQVAYGGSSTYKHTKSDHLFIGWTPSPTNITGDLNCIGAWETGVSFGSASWGRIAEIFESGQATEVFKLGDTREEKLTYADGTTESVTFEIVDTNSNKMISGTQMAIMATHALQTPQVYCETANNANAYYLYSTLRTYLTQEILPCFPEDMQSAIKSVSMPYATSDQKLHIPTLQMLQGKNYNENSANKTYWLEAFENGKSKIYKTIDGTAVEYWASSSYYYSGKNYATYVQADGTASYDTVGSLHSRYVVLLFFI